VIALSCIGVLLLAFFGGLYRLWASDATAIGTWLGIASGSLWTVASVVSVNHPQMTKTAGVLNVFGAICATGTVRYLLPDSEVPLIRAAIGLHRNLKASEKKLC
jgi:hypothetical protein